MRYIALALATTLLWFTLGPWSLAILLSIHITTMIMLILSGVKWRKTRTQALLMVSGMLMGISLILPKLYAYQTALRILPNETIFTIKILQNPPLSRGLKAKILKAKQPELVNHSLYLYPDPTMAQHPPLSVNEHYRVRLALKPINSPQFPAQRHKRLYLLSHQIIANAQPKSGFTLIKKQDALTHLRGAIQNHFSQHAYAQAKYLSALSVGRTEALTANDWRSLRRTGTIHLVSISGLHITFLALWGFIIIRTVMGLLLIQKPAPFEVAAVTSLFIALCYALLAGFSLPTQRALIMFAVAMLALLVRRPILSIDSLSSAMLIILILNPLSILSAGFWLSFTAVAVLIALARFPLSALKLILTTQLTVSLFMLPFSAYFFGEVSLISPVANFFAIPWTTIVILPSLLIGITLMGLMPSIAQLLFSLSDHALDFMLRILTLLEYLPYAAIEAPQLPFISALSLTTLGITILFYGLKNKLIIGLACLIALSNIGLLIPTKHRTTLDLFPVGEGLSALIQTPQKTILFDTGSYFRGFDAGRRILIPSLHTLRIPYLDAIILSKDNQQHIGGTRSIRNRYPKAPIIFPPSLKNYIDSSHLCHDYAYSLPEFTLSPLPVTSSCAFEISINQHKLWLIGDITPREWLTLMHLSQPDILLFPNQGRSKGFAIEKIPATTHILFSTRQINPAYATLTQTHKTANAYKGWVRIILKDNRIILERYHDEYRYWWMAHQQ